ncbi:phosphoglucomutase [Paenibacillus swuensis]|uniref:Phosphoglucomutase n=1 Tax=Paenibacillus swuensis TaxID=1178515 RepID=A0A172TIJ5_9BACL|nr:phospho-sugar mutase [Paenibacillus swuensis]ANE46687.1 phosphoglucomutase [Paenibacillus swuensis]
MTQTTRKASEIFTQWLQDELIDETTKEELRSIEGQDKEVEDRFYKDLAFGTGGLRGVVGAGTNRMNVYTVGRATQGFAEYLTERHPDGASAVIAYDSRKFSPEFSLEAALVLAGNGVKTYVFESLRPTPELSFAVRELKASAGIVVTASHNPPEYNGYKVYGEDGCQLVPEFAEQVISRINSIDSLNRIAKLTREEAESQGLLVWIGADVDKRYIDTITAVSRNKELIQQRMGSDFSIVFSPLHGAGNESVRAALSEIGFKNVHVVAEQERPDGNFSTVKSPNPEEREAFTLAIQLAEKVDADIIIGTDPDCDRMGAVVKNPKGEYFVLSGNQSGAIMVHYLLNSLKERNEMPANGVVIKTIVTSEMGATIAQHHGASVINTLTGFKYIGEKMTEFEATKQYEFLFGYEESYGYLAGTYARDKDAVIASMLICEAAAYYKAQGKTLYDVLQELYEQFGYFLESLESRTLKGKDGVEQINAIMSDWRNNAPSEIGGIAVTEVLDYELGLDELPKENVLKYKLADGSWFCLRPSGTEPKIKVYFAVQGHTGEEAAARLSSLTAAVMSRVDG